MVQHYTVDRAGARRGKFVSLTDALSRSVPQWVCLLCCRPGTSGCHQCSRCAGHVHRFDSTAEARRYAYLAALRDSGEISALVVQPSYPIIINGLRVAVYRADFRYTLRSGEQVVEDYKGSKAHQNPTSALRRKCAEALYGINVKITGGK